ncbi:hypothetical protein [Bacillus sp. mrc49]|uniref:hypothetical protein n=1 Tax=Bacillus sp. mrc49 TaxID=2054913 RepID=UPI0012FD8FF6|nr:hypothetical protein [Bacillus sp. mrc49]
MRRTKNGFPGEISTSAHISLFSYLKEDLTQVDERYKKSIEKLTICLMISQ